MRPVLDHCLKIDLAESSVRHIFRIASRGELRWSQGDANIASIAYVWTGGVLILRYRAAGIAHEQWVTIEKTVPNYGGIRRWFRCPISNTRVRALILPPDATRWAGRRAHDACYASQVETRRWRRGWGQLLHAIRHSDDRTRRNAVRRLRRRERFGERRLPGNG